jgi:hypothetical protein
MAPERKRKRGEEVPFLATENVLSINYGRKDSQAEVEKLINNIIENFNEGYKMVRISMVYYGQGHTFVLYKDDETEELWVIDVTKKPFRANDNYTHIIKTVAEELGDYTIKKDKPATKEQKEECTGAGGGFGWCANFVDDIRIPDILSGNYIPSVR